MFIIKRYFTISLSYHRSEHASINDHHDVSISQILHFFSSLYFPSSYKARVEMIKHLYLNKSVIIAVINILKWMLM